MPKLLARFLKKHSPSAHSIFHRQKSKKNPSKEDSSVASSLDSEDLSATVRLEDSQSELSTTSFGLIVTQLSLDGSVISFAGSPSSCEFLASSDTIPQETAETTAATETSPREDRKRVIFQDVTVRYYELVVGSHTNVEFPLSLGWNYQEQDTVKVEDYENVRIRRVQQKVSDRIRPRLYVPPEDSSVVSHYRRDVHIEEDYDDDVPEVLPLEKQERRTRLRSYGYSEAEVRCFERQRRVALALECSTAFPGEITPATGLSHPLFSYSRMFMTRYCF